ncbi:MAG: cytochrome c oxidase subunit II [Bacteroidota bacterium]
MKNRAHMFRIIGPLLLAGAAGCSGSPSILNPHGTAAGSVASLTWLMFALAGGVLLAITSLLWMVYRRSRRDQEEKDLYANDPLYLRNIVLGGAVAPILILLIIMGLGIRVGQFPAAPGNRPQVDIEIIGHQWWWEVRYANQAFTTANEIHIPVGKPVTLHLTSADVIHSFWVPELHGKMDLIPGQTNTITIEADRVGTYRGQCAEFCGVQHAHMAFLVIAQKADDFNAWVDGQNSSSLQPQVGSIEQAGQQAFLGSACVYCHTIQGTNASGHLGPDLTHLASRQTIGADLLPNTPGNLAGWILNSQSMKPGNHMPPMDMNGVQVQALLAYLATLK